MIDKLLIVIAILGFSWISCESVSKAVLMPNVSPKNKDAYLCHTFKLEDDKPFYITEFRPNSTKEIAHHILLYGCLTPGMEEETWNCGEMHKDSNPETDQYKYGPVCSGEKQSIIYAWAMDAPKLVLPEDVAFKVGGNTAFKYIVMQVHYANVEKFKGGATDNSGIILVGQYKSVSHTAGVYLTATGGMIEKKSTESFDAACLMRENVEFVPFAYRTHTHKLGVVNSGYVIKSNPKNGEQKWIEIGRRSPQLPQMFFPVSNNVTVRPGDVIASRCSMNNYQDIDVSIGSTGDDEMCNFYIMYYVKGDTTLEDHTCFTPGPPFWHFNNFRSRRGEKLQLDKIPEDISEVPEVQLKELDEIKQKGGMHQMHQMTSDMKMDEEEMKNEVSEEKPDIMSMNMDSQSDEAPLIENSDENSNEYENELDELERKHILTRLLKKYFEEESK